MGKNKIEDPYLSRKHLEKDISDLQKTQRKVFKKLMKLTSDRAVRKRLAFRIVNNEYSKTKTAKKNFRMLLKNPNIPLKKDGRFVKNDA